MAVCSDVSQPAVMMGVTGAACNVRLDVTNWPAAGEDPSVLGEAPGWHPVTPPGVVDACRLVAQHYGGRRGLLAYEAFDFINARYFSGRLPYPLIVWGLTPHGGCLGYAASQARSALPPVIVLHPSLLGGTERADPWGIPPEWLGWRYAFDTLLHECVHVHIEYVRGGRGKGTSSHNCDAWIAEVNRLAPLLGLLGVRATRSKVKRVAVDGPLTTRGKRPTKVARVCEGTLSLDAAARFPHAVRGELGRADGWYQRPGLPWQDDEDTCNARLGVTNGKGAA